MVVGGGGGKDDDDDLGFKGARTTMVIGAQGEGRGGGTYKCNSNTYFLFNVLTQFHYIVTG